MSKKKTIIDVKLKKGELTKHGYHPSNTKLSRHRALVKSIKSRDNVSKPKMRSTIRKLNLLSTFTKNSQKKNSKIYKSDQKWLSKKLSSLNA